jgi:hypothetical protein
MYVQSAVPLWCSFLFVGERRLVPRLRRWFSGLCGSMADWCALLGGSSKNARSKNRECGVLRSARCRLVGGKRTGLKTRRYEGRCNWLAEGGEVEVDLDGIPFRRSDQNGGGGGGEGFG